MTHDSRPVSHKLHSDDAERARLLGEPARMFCGIMGPPDLPPIPGGRRVCANCERVSRARRQSRDRTSLDRIGQARTVLLPAETVHHAFVAAARLGELRCPWRRAQELGLFVVHEDLSDDPRRPWGLTDGRSVWLDVSLSAIEMRSTLGHEVTHVELGLVESCDDATEAFIDLVTALRLVRPVALTCALTGHVEEAGFGAGSRSLGHYLEVDLETVSNRLRYVPWVALPAAAASIASHLRSIDEHALL